MARWLARFATALAATLVLGRCAAPAPAARDVMADGQWIWSRADAERYAESRALVPNLVPGVWVATVSFAHGAVTQRLALAPNVAPGAPIAAVVRFEDDFHASWDAMPDDALARAVGDRLTALGAALDASGARVAEVQLDYDCPERRLPRWANLVRSLGRGSGARGSLAGRPLWITSVPAHVAHEEYGALFRGAVAGHIIQVFDTGDRFGTTALGTLAAQLDAHRLPFRLGVGAFERTMRTGRRTEHRAWFAAAPALAASRWYRGMWVFPAGERWTTYREPMALAEREIR